MVISDLKMFVVGLSNSSLSSPSPDQYATCGSYGGTAPARSNITIECPTYSTARYVIIQQNADVTGHVALCEVEVEEKIRK